MNGFALTVDRAALLDDGLVASQSTGHATVEWISLWHSLKLRPTPALPTELGLLHFVRLLCRKKLTETYYYWFS